MKDVLVLDFSGTAESEGFLPWLKEEGASVEYRDWKGMEGVTCYCDPESEEKIQGALPEELPPVRWIDSGDYHYLSYVLAQREKEPFYLVLLDHHPDNQEPAFGGVLSCGGWVKTLEESCPLLEGVLTIGPEGCPEDIPEGWLSSHAGKRVYVSLDRDMMDREWARTDWSQGTHSLEKVLSILERLMEGPVQVVAIDVCGALSEEKGAQAEDSRINGETAQKLYTFIKKHFKTHNTFYVRK